MKTLTLALLSLAVVSVTLLVHWPVLSVHAMSFDDEEAVVQNRLVQQPGWNSVRRFFSEVLFSSVVRGYYRPLTLTSLMLDWAMGGRPDNLRVFHRTSLVLHLGSTLLIILLVHQVFRQPVVAALAGLLFGLHPLTVEPIAWVMERKTLLSALFALATLNAYVRYSQGQRRRWFAAALGFYLLSLLSKPTSTPLPIFLLLMDYWPLGRLNRRAVLEKIPFVALSAAFAVITCICEQRVNPLAVPAATSPLQTTLRLCYLIVFYPLKILVPLNLCPAYTLPTPLALSNGLVLLAVAGTITLILLAVFSRRWTPAIWVGMAIFYIGLAPTMGFVRYSWVVASDKYVYLPAVGLMLTVAWLLRLLWDGSRTAAHPGEARRRSRALPVRVAVCGVVLCLCVAEGTASRHLITRWRDTETLYRYMVRVSPRAPLAHNDLALEWVRQGRYDEAVAGYRKALTLAPQEAVIHNNLCEVLVRKGQFDEAQQECLEAIRLRSWYAEAYNNLGAAYIGMGRMEEAVKALDNALQHNPEYAEAYANLAHVLESRGQLDKAADCYRRALQLKPDNRFLLALGDVLAQKGDTDGALAAFLQGFSGPAGPATARRRLANLLAAMGNGPLAEEHYREALRLGPDSVDAHNDYGTALARWGRRAEAIAHFRTAIDLDGKHFAARCNLGLALAEEGRLDDAVQVLTAARQALPGSPQIEHTLGTVLLYQGKPDEAAVCFRRALQFDPGFEPARLALQQCGSRPSPPLDHDRSRRGN